MKKVFLTLIVLCIVLMCGALSTKTIVVIGGSFTNVDESKLQFTEQRTFEHFEGISFDYIGADVKVHFADEFKIIIRTNNDFMNLITTDVKKNILTVSMKRNDLKEKMVACDVYLPSISSLDCSGSVRVTLDEGNSADVKISVSGSGKIDLTKHLVDNLNGSISGSGKALLGSGRANSLIFNISGSGNIEAADVMYKSIKVDISGSGRADVYAEETLNASISGSGRVNYKGKPVINSSVSGSGKINHIGDGR